MSQTSKRNTLDFSGKLEIYALLNRDDVLTVTGPDLCAYVGSWNDEMVAGTLTREDRLINATNVAHVRKAKFGHLYERREPTAPDLLDTDAITALEKRIADVEARLAGRDQKVEDMRLQLEGKGQAIIEQLKRLNTHDRRLDAIVADVRDLTLQVSRMRLSDKFKVVP